MDWKFTWLFSVWIGGLLEFQIAASSNYTLHVPSEYIALTTDIQVGFSLPQGSKSKPHAVHLHEVGNNDTIAAVELRLGVQDGHVTFLCGMIDHAGQFIFKLYVNEGQETIWVATSALVQVSWPNFIFLLPRTHRALTDAVRLNLRSTGARCNSRFDTSNYWLEVVYFGTEDSPSVGTFPLKVSVVESVFPPNLHDESMTLACDLFDLQGIYSVVLRSSHNPPHMIASSNNLTVLSSLSKYQLIKPNYRALSQCNEKLRILYKIPTCYHSNDKIRLYSVDRKVEGSINIPAKSKFITERRVKPSNERDYVNFRCKLFKENVETYCFVYVHIAQTGAVFEETQICLPTKDSPDPVIHGRWSEWEAWSECTVTCGQGKRNRYRLCDNPVPANGGDRCGDDSISWTDCSTECFSAKLVDVTQLAPPAASLEPLSSCACGCNLTMDSGHIESSVRCDGSSLWTITVPDTHIIKITFDVFNLDPKLQSLKLRDGASEKDKLLVHWKEGTPPGPIESSGNSLFVQLWSDVQYKIETKDFILKAGYNAMVTQVPTKAFYAESDEDKNKAFWESTGTIIGVVACVLIVLITIAFVLHHCVWKRRKREILKKQANGELPLGELGKGNMSPQSGRFAHLLQPGSSLTSDAPSSFGTKKYRRKSHLNRAFKTFKGETNVSSKNSSNSSLMAATRAGVKPMKLRTSPADGEGKVVTSPYGTKPEDFFHNTNIFTAPAKTEEESKFDTLNKRKHKDQQGNGNDKKQSHDRDKKQGHKGHKHKHRLHSPDKHKHKQDGGGHKSGDKTLDSKNNVKKSEENLDSTHNIPGSISTEGVAADKEVRTITGGVDVHATADGTKVVLSGVKKKNDKNYGESKFGPNVAIVSPSKAKAVPAPVAPTTNVRESPSKLRSRSPSERHETRSPSVDRAQSPINYPSDQPPSNESKGKALKRGQSGPKNKHMPLPMATIKENISMEGGGTSKRSQGVTASTSPNKEIPERLPSDKNSPLVQYPYPYGPYPVYYGPMPQLSHNQAPSSHTPIMFYPPASTPPGGLPAQLHTPEGHSPGQYPMGYFPVIYPGAYPFPYPGAGEGMAPYPQYMRQAPVSNAPSGNMSPKRTLSPVHMEGMIPYGAPPVMAYLSSEDDRFHPHSSSSRESANKDRKRQKSRSPDKQKLKSKPERAKSPTKQGTLERGKRNRPDGKSPGLDSTPETSQNKSENNAASSGNELSPLTRPRDFNPPLPRSNQSPASILLSDGLEYDTYLPNVPGSYLNNEEAYHMKWPRYGKPGTTTAREEAPGDANKKEK